mmetsp:Transcript_97898/g.245255  ORF Transcript_97898/g.245255 Transcript_97898/m.245255 type:complete len:231 (-) Transcript_97898:242-934(-)
MRRPTTLLLVSSLCSPDGCEEEIEEVACCSPLSISAPGAATGAERFRDAGGSGTGGSGTAARGSDSGGAAATTEVPTLSGRCRSNAAARLAMSVPRALRTQRTASLSAAAPALTNAVRKVAGNLCSRASIASNTPRAMPLGPAAGGAWPRVASDSRHVFKTIGESPRERAERPSSAARCRSSTAKASKVARSLVSASRQACARSLVASPKLSGLSTRPCRCKTSALHSEM